MTDRLDELFTTLRADTITRVRPRGPGAARRTLRRRRAVRTVSAAACLAVAGTLGLHPLGRAPAPDRDPAAATDRQRRAAAVLPGAPGYPYQRGAQDVVGDDGTVATKVMVGGTYTLRLVCVGRGRLTLGLFTGGGQRVGAAEAECTTAGRMVAAPFDLAFTMPIEVRLDANRDARGAGYAYSVELSEPDRERLITSAGTMLPAVRGRVLSEEAGLAAVSTGAGSRLDPGRYRLSAACSGAGHIQVRVRVPDRTEILPLACGWPSHAGETTFQMAKAGDLRFTLDPNPDADRQSGYRMRLERLD